MWNKCYLNLSNCANFAIWGYHPLRFLKLRYRWRWWKVISRGEKNISMICRCFLLILCQFLNDRWSELLLACLITRNNQNLDLIKINFRKLYNWYLVSRMTLVGERSAHSLSSVSRSFSSLSWLVWEEFELDREPRNSVEDWWKKSLQV